MAVLALLVGGPAFAADRAPEFPQVVSVSESYNHSPFEYRIESCVDRARYSIYRLTYPSPVVTPVPQNNTIPAEYYLPTGVGPEGPKRPAVICMHILEGDFALVRMTCSKLAAHGIPAIMFKLPYYGERGLPEGPDALAADPKLLLSALAQAMEDVRRTVDVLAARPEVNPERIGITGISLGGIVATTAAERDPRVWRVMPVLAGGDLERIIHHAWETRQLSRLIRQLPPDQRAEVERAIDAVDPLRDAERLRERAQDGRVLMVNATDDEVIPRDCTDKLAAALGITDRVTWLQGLGHYTAMVELPQVLEKTAEFFGQDMPPGLMVTLPSPPSRTALEVVVALLQQASVLLISQPQEGRCHFADLELSFTPRGQSAMQGHLRLIRGWRGRFKLDLDLPFVGRAALGQSTYPWMVSGGTVVFKGVGDAPAEIRDPLAYAEPVHLTRLQMLAGLVAGLSFAPDILNDRITVVEETAPGGPRTIRITQAGGRSGSVRLTLKDDGRTPARLAFDVSGVRVAATFRGWQTGAPAHEAMFDPPAGLREQRVDPTDLYRIFSAMFNFAMESAQ